MAKSTRSVEEQVEDWAKEQFRSSKRRYYAKTESINTVIELALKKAPSKQGGLGLTFPT